MFVGPMVNSFLDLLPLLGEDTVVLQDCLLNDVGHQLELLVTLLSICCRDQQSAIRNKMISDETNCLLYRVSGFSIPS